jgi:Kef-type K+ transport system membrane component KefB
MLKLPRHERLVRWLITKTMKLKHTLIYFSAVIVVGCAIAVVLQLGTSSFDMSLSNQHTIPVPAQEHVVVASDASSRPFQALRANLNHPLSHLLMQLLVVITAARVLGSLFTRIGLPAVVGEMAAGILLGPSLFGFVAPSLFAITFPAQSLGALQLLSQVGVCLFMFAVGMELNVAHVRNKAPTAVAVSHASILAPFFLGVLLALYLFEEQAGPRATFTGFALFMGISMSITAFPVLARILQERGMSQTFLGSTAIACAAVDDVTAWSIMAFVVAIARSTSVFGAVLTLAMAVVFIVVMTQGVRRVLPRWIGAARLKESEPSSGTLAIVVCVAIAAALSTEVIGIHALFGAFLAGAIMPSAEGFREKIAALVAKFSSVLLLPLFFAFTGLRTELGLLTDLHAWLVCLLIIVVATAGKLGASALTARITGMSWRESLQLGALMNTRGLMELIALNIGYELEILSASLFTMLVVMALVTTLMTGPLVSLFNPRRQTMAAQSSRSLS